MRRKYIIFSVIVLLLLSGCVNKNTEKNVDTELRNATGIDDQNLDIDIEEQFIPTSFDNYYKTKPSEYLLNMKELSRSMENVIIDLQEGNINNAKKSFDIFSQNYKNSSNMVPEWNMYYDISEIERLGNAINSGNVSEAFKMTDYVRDACTDCHTEIRYVVWAKYYWKDFQNINMSTTNSSKMSWTDAKNKYLLPGFEGIGVGIRNNQKDQAIKSFKLFKDMFINMKDACNSCHDTERKYYVDTYVISMIDNMEKEISTGNLNKAEEIRQKINGECHKCHIIHEPLQRIKELEE